MNGKWAVVKIEGRNEYLVGKYSNQNKAEGIASELRRNGGTYVVRRVG